jgi:hypothetical protein
VIEKVTRAEYEALLRQDFATFAARCFHDLNPQAELAMSWHLEVIAANLTAVREGKIPRLIINLIPGAVADRRREPHPLVDLLQLLFLCDFLARGNLRVFRLGRA